MIKFIDYALQNSDKELIICQRCENSLTSIKDAEVYLNVAYKGKEPVYYYVSKLWSINQMPKERFYCHQFNYELGVVAPFKLMQLGRVKCAKCQTPIGMYIRSTNGEATDWLKHRVLFDEDCVTFLRSDIRFVLSQHLKENLEEEKNEEKQKEKADKQVNEMAAQQEQLIKNALRNIAFYSRVLDDLKRRNEEVVALSKYQLVKSRSEKKRMSNRF